MVASKPVSVKEEMNENDDGNDANAKIHLTTK